MKRKSKDKSKVKFDYKLCMKHPICKGCPKESECDKNDEL